MSRLVSRLKWLHLVPVLAILSLLAWGFASPTGSSPDDDFHLTSIWCASSSPDAHCTEGRDPAIRTAPTALLESGCYLPDAGVSASCQATGVDWDPTETEPTARGNFVGGYPPVFYAVMGLFVQPDIRTAVMTMRLVSVLLFVVLTSVIFVLLPSVRRPTLMLGWLVTTVPLGMFLIPSNNPSSWAVIGVGSAWLALLGWFETSGRRKVGLGIAFGLATLVAAGSRGDGAVYTAVGISIVLGLVFTPTKRFVLNAVLPLVFMVVCVYFFVSAQQVISGWNGFGGAASPVAGETRDPVALAAFNLLNVPSLWAGVFGSWGLGWLEVGMPSVVALGSLSCFLVAAAVGFGRLTMRKAIALAIIGTALVAVPVVVLTRGGDIVGNEVQPRYLLPLIVLLAGVLLLQTGSRPIVFNRGHLILIALTLIVTQFVALHTTIRRYVTGDDEQGLNLDAGVEWWWSIPLSPMGVLIVGSAAYSAMVWIVMRDIHSHSEAETQPVAARVVAW